MIMLKLKVYYLGYRNIQGNKIQIERSCLADIQLNYTQFKKIQMDQGQERDVILWQDIEKLNTRLQKAQAKRFWACYIFLFIVPPKYQQNGKGLWKLPTGQKSQNGFYPSECRYDQFVASHGTCCQHMNHYFIYYHRNFLNKWAFALNQADIVLKSKASTSEVVKWMRKNIQEKVQDGRRKESEQNFEDLMEAARKEYEQILQELDNARIQRNLDKKYTRWVSPFYWNVLDYKNKIRLPNMLREQTFDGKQMEMHKLFKAYKKCNFGQMNFYDTWGQKNTKSLIQQSKDFNVPTREPFINNLKKCGKSHLTNLTDEQINKILGGKGFNHLPDQKIDQDISLEKVSQNLKIPYYFYFKNVYNEKFARFSSFLFGEQNNNSVEHPHNNMHDSLGYVFALNSYAVCNPLFCMYHACIDLMVEQYLRKIKHYDTPTDQAESEVLYKGKAVKDLKTFLNSKGTCHEIYHSSFETNNIVTSYHNQPSQNIENGEYPIIEWIDTRDLPNNPKQIIKRKHYFAFGQYRNLMLKKDEITNNDRLRYSYEQQDCYKDYLKLSEQNISQELKQYPFNYQYDILSKDDGKLPDGFLYVSQKSFIRILMKMLELEHKKPQQKAAQRQMLSLKASSPNLIQQNSLKKFKSLMQKEIIAIQTAMKSPNSFFSIENHPQIIRALAFKQKIDDYSLFYGRVQYLSTIESVNVHLKLKIKDLDDFAFINSGEKSISSSMSKIRNQNGQITVKYYYILTKGSQAESCPNCMEYKASTFNLFDYFEGYLTPFFIDLHLNAEFGILYDSRNRKKTEKNFGQILEAVHDYRYKNSKNQFKFTFPRGSNEVTFRLIKCNSLDGTDQQIQDSFYSYKFTLEAESVDLMTDEPFVSLIAHKDSLNTEISFESLRAHKNPKKPRQTKQLVYQNFNGTLLAFKGNHLWETKHFSFSIMNYCRSASYDIRVDDLYEILVRDSNYYTKRQVFN